MTRAEIQAFLAVVECGSFSSAADNLFLSQSTLSGRIQTLEQELSMTLFKRGKGIRSSELTASGRDFIPIAEKWEQLWKETLMVSERKKDRILSVSAILSINAYIMAAVYDKFAASNPSVKLRLLIRHSNESYHLIESGGAEAAFITMPHFSKKVEAVPLFHEKLLFACNEGCDFPDTVHPSALSVENEILLDWHLESSQWHDYWFGQSSTPRIYTDDMSIMENFLRTERCWTVLPATAAHALEGRGGIRLKQLTDGPRDRTVYLLRHSMAPPSEELSRLLMNMEEVMREQGAEWVYER